MRTAPNSNDLRTLTAGERLVASFDAMFRSEQERRQRVRRQRLEREIKRDLDYGRC